MIVTKARDHNLVQLTRDLAEWLMTTPRHGKPYGVKVHVDAKLEKSKRFDADGLYKDHKIILEKSLLQYWTPESCVFADTFDFVITVRLRIGVAYYSSVETVLYCIHLGSSSGSFRPLFHSTLDLSDFSPISSTTICIQISIDVLTRDTEPTCECDLLAQFSVL